MSWEHFLVIPGLGSASRVVGILAGTFWLLSVLFKGKVRKLTLFHGCSFLFVLWNAASILWTIDPGRTLIQIITYAQMALLSFMIWDLYTTPSAIRAALQAYVIGLTVPIVSTITHFVSSIGTDYALYGRYSASGSNSNTTGILLAMGLPLAWYLAVSVGKGKVGQVQRLVNYAYIPIIIFTIILTATRFAIIMSLPAFIFGLGTFGKLRPGLRVSMFTILAAGLLTLGSLIPSASFQRLGTIDDELQRGDLNDRSELWLLGIDIWLEHPLIGIGSAAYDTAVAPIYGRKRAVHNSFIAVAAELGIVGIGLFGIILVIAVLQALSHPSRWDARFWLTVLAVWALGNFALTWVYAKPTWLMLSLIVASAHLSRPLDMSRSHNRPNNGHLPTVQSAPAILFQTRHSGLGS